MANLKISELTALTGANSAADDLVVIVDTSAAQTKKMTRAELVAALTSGNFTFLDSSGATDNRLVFGAGTDLSIYHDGSNSHIEDGGTGALKITTSQLEVLGTGETLAKFIDDGAVELYHDNTKKFETTSAGATLTGALTTTGAIVVGGDLTVNGTTTTVNSNTIEITNSFTFEGSTADNNELVLSAGDPTADRTVTLPDATTTLVGTDATQTLTNKTIDATQLSGTVANARLDAQLQDVAGLATTDGGFIVGNGSNFVLESGSTARDSLGLGSAALSAASSFVAVSGDAMTGNLTFGDNNKAVFGTGSDLEVFHNGTNSIIEGKTGDLILRTVGSESILLTDAGGNNLAQFNDNSDVKLYHNANEKLATTSSGVTVTGTVAATALTGDGSGITGLSSGVSAGFAIAMAVAL